MANTDPATRDEFHGLRRKVNALLAAVIVLAACFVGLAAWPSAGPRASMPDVLQVERLDIVEPDGSIALALSNSRRVPIATINGEVLLADQGAERTVPAIIFFDGKGDEVGGLMFGAEETAEGFSATRHFSLDGYKQDQTVVLFHYENQDGARAGLQVLDRHGTPAMPEALRQLGLELPVTREALNDAISALPDDGRDARLRELFGVQRLFLGSDRNDDAALVLRDGDGRERIRIEVSAAGEAAITVLDAEGAVVARLPEG